MVQTSSDTPQAEPIVPHWIGGQRVTAAAEKTVPVTRSATGEVVARVSMGGGAEHVRAAVATAAEAFPAWRDTPPPRRSKILFAYRALLDARRDDLIDLIVTEHGKVADDAAGEVERGLEVLEFVCGIPHLLKGEFSENVSTQIDSYSLRQPLGVMAGVTPFNFPVMVPMWMFPVAIACGNTFVLKPSEKDPSPSILLAELSAQAGLPPGVLNVVQGGPESVDALLTHEDVKGISFGVHTGRTARSSCGHRARQARAGSGGSEEPCRGAA
jgi:malonate-semialdehyde dehydrogenase (acetylating) / methylmalonate-semialdehyde dehydrogenase